MFSRILFYSFCFSLIVLPADLIGGLFPDNVIYLSPGKCCKVKDLSPGDTITSLKRVSNKDNHCLREVVAVKEQKEATKAAVLITLQSDKRRTSFIVVEDRQMFCLVDEMGGKRDFSDTVLWIQARNLKKGLRVRGYKSKSFVVKNIERITSDEAVDLYELSLPSPHTFYLIDSNGNKILTHNIAVAALIFIGCLVTGAVIGGGVVVYKLLRRGKRVTFLKVVAGAATGAVVGGLVSGISYLGVCLGKSAVVFIAKKLVKKPEVVKEAAKEVFEVLTDAEKFEKTVKVVSEVVAGVVSLSFKIFEYTDDIIESYLNDTEQRENEDTDFSDIDGEEIFVREGGRVVDAEGNPVRVRIIRR